MDTKKTAEVSHQQEMEALRQTLVGLGCKKLANLDSITPTKVNGANNVIQFFNDIIYGAEKVERRVIESIIRDHGDLLFKNSLGMSYHTITGYSSQEIPVHMMEYFALYLLQRMNGMDVVGESEEDVKRRSALLTVQEMEAKRLHAKRSGGDEGDPWSPDSDSDSDSDSDEEAENKWEGVARSGLRQDYNSMGSMQIALANSLLWSAERETQLSKWEDERDHAYYKAAAGSNGEHATPTSTSTAAGTGTGAAGAAGAVTSAATSPAAGLTSPRFCMQPGTYRRPTDRDETGTAWSIPHASVMRVLREAQWCTRHFARMRPVYHRIRMLAVMALCKVQLPPLGGTSSSTAISATSETSDVSARFRSFARSLPLVLIREIIELAFPPLVANMHECTPRGSSARIALKRVIADEAAGGAGDDLECRAPYNAGRRRAFSALATAPQEEVEEEP